MARVEEERGDGEVAGSEDVVEEWLRVEEERGGGEDGESEDAVEKGRGLKEERGVREDGEGEGNIEKVDERGVDGSVCIGVVVLSSACPQALFPDCQFLSWIQPLAPVLR